MRHEPAEHDEAFAFLKVDRNSGFASSSAGERPFDAVWEEEQRSASNRTESRSALKAGYQGDIATFDIAMEGQVIALP